MAPGIIGQILATQCLKIIIGLPNILCKKLLLINLLEDLFKVVKIRGRQSRFFQKLRGLWRSTI